MPKQCLSVLRRASIPALQPWPRRNQRCFCRAARVGLKRPRAGSTTCLTPNRAAAFSLALFQKPRSAAANRGARSNSSTCARLELLDLLGQAERSVEDLAGEANLSIANASQH